MKIFFRPLTEHDYPAFAKLINACHPDDPATEEALRFRNAKRGGEEKHGWFLLESDRQIIGACGYEPSSVAFHPRKFRISLYIHPSWRGRGVEAQLYDHLEVELSTLKPISLMAKVREDDADLLALFSAHGFEEASRSWKSYLDVAAFDPAPFEGVQQKVAAAGITIRTLAELPRGEATLRAHYEMNVEILEDVPWEEPFSPWPFERWKERFLDNPNLLSESYFIAFSDDTFIGVSELYKSGQPEVLQTGLTGVRRNYRRQGIALALKLSGIAYAQGQGIRRIYTENHSINRPMLAINEALGFVKEPAWIQLRKSLREEA